MELRCGPIQRFRVNKIYFVIFKTLFYYKNIFGFGFSRPVHGLIFLFKYVQDDEPTGSIVRDGRLEKIFFAKQVKCHFIKIFQINNILIKLIFFVCL